MIMRPSDSRRGVRRGSLLVGLLALAAGTACVIAAPPDPPRPPRDGPGPARRPQDGPALRPGDRPGPVVQAHPMHAPLAPGAPGRAMGAGGPVRPVQPAGPAQPAASSPPRFGDDPGELRAEMARLSDELARLSGQVELLSRQLPQGALGRPDQSGQDGPWVDVDRPLGPPQGQPVPPDPTPRPDGTPAPGRWAPPGSTPGPGPGARRGARFGPGDGQAAPPGARGDAADGPAEARFYRLAPGKLEAFRALLTRDDVPIVVSPQEDGISVQASPRQHEVFAAFLQMIDAAPEAPHARQVK